MSVPDFSQSSGEMLPPAYLEAPDLADVAFLIECRWVRRQRRGRASDRRQTTATLVVGASSLAAGRWPRWRRRSAPDRHPDLTTRLASEGVGRKPSCDTRVGDATRITAAGHTHRLGRSASVRNQESRLDRQAPTPTLSHGLSARSVRETSQSRPRARR